MHKNKAEHIFDDFQCYAIGTHLPAWQICVKQTEHTLPTLTALQLPFPRGVEGQTALSAMLSPYPYSNPSSQQSAPAAFLGPTGILQQENSYVYIYRQTKVVRPDLTNQNLGHVPQGPQQHLSIYLLSIQQNTERIGEHCEDKSLVGPADDLLLTFLFNFAPAPFTTRPALSTAPNTTRSARLPLPEARLHPSAPSLHLLYSGSYCTRGSTLPSFITALSLSQSPFPTHLPHCCFPYTTHNSPFQLATTTTLTSLIPAAVAAFQTEVKSKDACLSIFWRQLKSSSGGRN